MVLRAIIVLISVGVAMSIPYFDLFLSLIGGLGSAQLMFILPPISYLVKKKQSCYLVF
jgi:amino acid permease